eukprot:TRINITY_DN207_c0_g1_i9.p1 TRINITY_DN207_c0_g1~~TRINITY_DN207_c0_g1_i9.p1  ORF type:complete len:1292 (+),score=488.05 TRINITY_DN207_c0_g1_i9:201-4076(+)
MGCGASQAGEKKDGGAAKTQAPPPKEQERREQGADKSKEPAPAAAASGAAPGAGGGSGTAPTAAAAPAGPVEDCAAARERCMPAPLLVEVSGVKDQPGYLVSCYSGEGGVVFACRCEGPTDGHKPITIEATPVHIKVCSAAQLGALREGLQGGEGGEAPEWKSFWKMLATALQCGRVSVQQGGARLEFSLRQSRDPKEQSLAVDLSPAEGTPAAVYQHFAAPFARLFLHRRGQLDAEGKGAVREKRELREADYSKMESEGSARFDAWALSEAVIQAAACADHRSSKVLPELRSGAERMRRDVGLQQNRIAKMNQVLEMIKCGAPSHPLDRLYGEEGAPESVKFADPEPVAADAFGLSTDVDSLGADLPRIAFSLFNHYGLIDHFSMDKQVLVAFWRAVQERCNENAFHGAKHAADMMVVMSAILGTPEQQGSLSSRVRMSKEDIFSLLLSAGITDLHHEGVDNAFIKRAGNMLSMLYSDLYQNEQNALTAAFELMYNPSWNILKTLTPEQVKDVTESVREALFIKANVKMGTPGERFDEFKQILSGSPDWSTKDNVRLVLTHALRMCQWSPWARPLELHLKWLDRVREEFYQQGEQEARLGLPPSRFHDTVWTSDRGRDDADFAAGQAGFIDAKALPLFTEMQRLAPDLDGFVTQAKANRGHWEAAGAARAAQYRKALQAFGKVFTLTAAEAGPGVVALARPGPDLVRPGLCLWVSACDAEGRGYGASLGESQLAKAGAGLGALREAFCKGAVASEVGAGGCTLRWDGAALHLPPAGPEEAGCVLASAKSYLELRRCEKTKDIEKGLERLDQGARAVKDRALSLEGEAKALRGCLAYCAQRIQADSERAAEIEGRLRAEAGDTPVDDLIKLEREDALGIKVRNPLKAPLPPGVLQPPDCKAVDGELLQLLKSAYYTKGGGADGDLGAPVDPQQAPCCNAVLPLLSSEFYKVTKNIPDPTRKKIFDLVQEIDKWDYDVFELQKAMSGGICGESLRQQPNGGALFITTYALFFKWQFMQKFGINERTLLNWLSIVEAGYHPNPYHNSMHAADVLQVTHYIISKGGLQRRIRATDEEVFAALFAAAVHDYNHPGINNAFHVRSQNYLAVLFNDRSVNENIHASSVFELMRMDDFNILAAFQGADHTRMRDDIVEFILGTDMGLHAMFVGRFKKRLEATDSKMYKTKTDRNLALTMAVKMADISNCGRPKKLYHGWCNVIVDEFFQQGDRERLQGMPVSPFMDRHTTVMSKGQIGFMNYIVMPLFECMGEYLEDMHMATVIAEENKGFWQENEDW